MSDTKVGIFLDADGVLWPDTGAGGILEGLVEARRRLRSLTQTLERRENVFIGVVSNQTLAARAVIPFEDFRLEVFSTFNSLQEDSLIDDFRVCFHHPNANYLPLRIDNCSCRKPKPGMIHEAKKKWHIDLDLSFLVGDRWRDIETAKNTSITTILIDNHYDEKKVNADFECSNFEEAVNFILKTNQNQSNE